MLRCRSTLLSRRLAVVAAAASPSGLPASGSSGGATTAVSCCPAAAAASHAVSPAGPAQQSQEQLRQPSQQPPLPISQRQQQAQHTCATAQTWLPHIGAGERGHSYGSTTSSSNRASGAAAALLDEEEDERQASRSATFPTPHVLPCPLLDSTTSDLAFRRILSGSNSDSDSTLGISVPASSSSGSLSSSSSSLHPASSAPHLVLQAAWEFRCTTPSQELILSLRAWTKARANAQPGRAFSGLNWRAAALDQREAALDQVIAGRGSAGAPSTAAAAVAAAAAAVRAPAVALRWRRLFHSTSGVFHSDAPTEVAEDEAGQLRDRRRQGPRLRKRERYGTYEDDIEEEVEESAMELDEETHLYDSARMVDQWLHDPTFWGMLAAPPEDDLVDPQGAYAQQQFEEEEGPELRWQTRLVLGPGGNAWHPANRKVKVSVYVRELNLTPLARQRLIALVGRRYNKHKDELTIVSERFRHREENRKDVLRTLLALIEEAQRADELVASAAAAEEHHPTPPASTL